MQIADSRIVDCRLAIALGIGDSIGDWRLAIADCRLPIADCRLPIADCRLKNVPRAIAWKIAFPAYSEPLSAQNVWIPADSSDGPPRATAMDMNPKALELQARTQKFATDVILFCEGLPKDIATQKIVGQLLDAAGSTDSNYRATCRARSTDEFIAKIGVAAEEADESKGWLELLVSSGKATEAAAAPLIKEADELTAIFVASRMTATANQERRKEIERQQRSRRRR